jgi:beta-galactosidase
MKHFILLLAVASCLALHGRAASPEFTTRDGRFLLNGQPFQIISGEMHYPRIPRPYWHDRFRMAKAMGLNTITTYVFWNEHEPRPGVYDFSGNNDIAEFVKEAQQEGLYVILRPGPYVCAEWEFGGFPAWLLKDHSLVVRSRDPKFMAAVERWMHRLGQELAPLQIGNGGPIIAVQVENEYGSFGDDHTYMQQMHHLLTESGFNRSLLYTADGPEELPKGSLPGLPVGINFGGSDGPDVARDAFAMLRKFRSGGPSLNSEYWDGWFDHWGGTHASTSTANQAANLGWMLQRGYSVSLYMFHGGTSFGWMNGANSNGKNYEPDVTSYDYDSPLDESGRPTPKYFVFRDEIQKATGVVPPPVPDVPPAIAVPAFTLSKSASLWGALPTAIHSEQPLSMEDLDQAYGYILYRTHLAGPLSGDLVLDELHDYAQIYLNGKLAGTLDRRLGQNHLRLNLTEADSRLDILMENSGRVNFTAVLRGERKGITKQVTLAGKPVTGWDIYTLPMMNVSSLAYSTSSCEGACFYRATLDVDKAGDTFLDTSGLSKGQVWLNGRPLGRVWSIGPQKTLYVPGPWLKQGKNELVVFDLNGRPDLTLKCQGNPDLGPTTLAK